jgi:hypothetical protein
LGAVEFLLELTALFISTDRYMFYGLLLFMIGIVSFTNTPGAVVWKFLDNCDGFTPGV